MPEKQPNQRVEKRPKQTFLQRRHTDGQQTLEKMLNITHYQRNANQNCNDISPHTSQNGHHQKVYTINAGEGVEKREPSLHCWWECKLIQPLWKTVWRFLKKLGIKPPYDQQYPNQAYTLRKPKLKKTQVLQCSLQHYGSNLDVRQQMNG